MIGLLNKSVKIRSLAHFGKAVDVFNRDNGQIDILGRLRTTYKATVSLERDGLQVTMTGSNGEFGHFVIPYTELEHADQHFNPSQCRGMLEAMSKKLAIPSIVPADILIPQHFTGM